MGIIPPTPIFDLETYISRYEEDSNTRLERLLFLISNNNTNTNNNILDEETIKQARILAEKQIKSMYNTKAYKELYEISKTKKNKKKNDTNMNTSDDDDNNNKMYYGTEWINKTNTYIQTQYETLRSRL